jgi:NAD(P)-dependent dehydrogenase (short-subunit alcohol dehydrogenase family)
MWALAEVKNKVAIVTGGSRGIGRAVAAAFLRNGASVMLAARSKEELAAAKAELAGLGGRVEVFAADVSLEEDMFALVKNTVDILDGLDIVVNAAGAYGAIGAVGTVDAREWKKTFDVNLFGTFNVAKAALSAFAAAGTSSGHKKIINFSGGGDGPLPNFSAYSTSKIAVVRFTETLAKELAGQNIDVNAVAPGAVNTKILEDAIAAGERVVGKEMYQKLLKQKEEGGVGPEKAAELCVFLASASSDGLSGKLVSAIWDNYNEWSKADIDQLMQGDKLNIRRVNL